MANMRVSDPNVLVNIAHVAQNRLAAIIVGIGTSRTLATCRVCSASTKHRSSRRGLTFPVQGLII